MKSMTGYGRATSVLGNSTLTVQVNSVNRKTLDLSVSLPADWDDFEAEIRDAVREVALRGKVHVRIEITGDTPNRNIEWDDEAVATTLARLRATVEAQQLAFNPTPELLWQIANSHRQNGANVDSESARDVALEALQEALRAFAAMRAKEGESLLIDFLGRMDILKRLVESIALRAPEVAPAHRDTLMKRLGDSGLDFDLDDERVLKEIAFFADRCDVTEEITRLRSHLDQFATLIRTDAEIGRKAEFILQEIGREVNTIGSKANDLAIARHVIEMKNELDRVREQIANVE
ncbi:MAG: YicC family protein [Cephaloticoccus sp.]|nr:YicC family protein [Cephaloticoccus sp.]MCF7761038.1 YicC family protein [Cephaloticoccus sp.]